MSRAAEAAELLLMGNSPSAIAYRMGVTVSTVLGYLYRKAGEGKIQRSDIILSISRDTRDLIEAAIHARKSTVPWKIKRWVKKRDPRVREEDVQAYLALRAARVQFGDIYESVRDIETFLHALIRDALLDEYGEGWWRQIPEEVRVDCVCALERDPSPAREPFCYTTLIHLRKIFDNKWAILGPRLPKEFARRKKEFLSRMDSINPIRNAVMHPAKRTSLHDQDFALVREFQKELTKGKPDETWEQVLAKIPVTASIQ
jgi:hypothetical protein